MTDQITSSGVAACAGSGVDAGGFQLIIDGDGRSAADDLRIAIHEGSHCLSGLALFGIDSVGGATIVPNETYGGRTWGKLNSAELGSSREDIPSDLCDQLRAVMPADFHPKSGASEIYAHVVCRVTDLLSGTEGERLLCGADAPWLAESDLIQARLMPGSSAPAQNP